jgi:aldehyde dehydrogenase (NAD+)
MPSAGTGWSQLFLGGEWVRGGGGTIADDDPYSGELLANVGAASADDVDHAFEIADRSMHAYRTRTPQELAQPILDAIELLRSNIDKVAQLLTLESGSTATKARFEVEQVTIPMMQEAASFPFRSFGTSIRSRIPGTQNVTERLPAGIVSVISPWNFPLHLSMRAVAPALALGNAVILKPSSDTPITGGLLLAELFDKTSLPKGLFSVLPGHGEQVGDRIAGNTKNNVVAFTGSTEVGREVAAKAAGALARPAMELGGNNVHIVLDDADLDHAVAAGIFGSFFHQGQICMRINRHLVHRSVYEDYVREFTARAGALRWGDPRDASTEIGPVINQRQHDRIMSLVEESVGRGATVTTGGASHGLVIEPTVLRDMANDYPAAFNEVFGPVAPIIPFDTDDEAIALANGTPYGLSGSVQSRDMARAYEVASAVETGMIHINDQGVNDEPQVPFGGMKASGMGRYNTETIMDEMTTLKWYSFQLEPRQYPI